MILQFVRRSLDAALVIVALTTVSGIAHAQGRDCGLARDPERCVRQEAALASCADLPSRDKQRCLEDKLPPPDCSKAPNPARCEAVERAKQRCAGMTGKPLKACLRGEAPAKANKTTKEKQPKKKKDAKATKNDKSGKPKGPPPVRLEGS